MALRKETMNHSGHTTSARGPVTPPRLERRLGPEGTERINLSGVWNLQALEGRLTGISQQLAACAADPHLHWDLRDIDALDDAGAWLLWRAWGRCLPEHVSLLPEQQSHFSQLASTPRASSGRSHWDPAVPVARLGAAVLSLAEQTLGIVALLGQILNALARVLRLCTRRCSPVNGALGTGGAVSGLSR